MKKGQKMTEEQKRKLSIAHLGQKLSKETKRKLSESLIGRKKPIRTEEHRKKISDAHKKSGLIPPSQLGKKLSEEHKRKLLESNLGQKRSEESRKKMSIASKGKKLSKEHKRKLSMSHIGLLKGENNHNWKGGITPENHKIRTSLENKLFRDAVFARDGYTCQKTGIKGIYLVVHHILNFAQYPELRFAINNGITLSKEDHKEFHKKYGFKNNTREHLEEFLKDSIILSTNKN